jgi:hypothetical protein
MVLRNGGILPCATPRYTTTPSSTTGRLYQRRVFCFLAFVNSQFCIFKELIVKPLRRSCCVCLLSSLFVFTQLGGAQSGTSSLSGTITDANQAVVQGAEVTLSNLQTGFSRKAASDDRGNYHQT